MDGWKTRVKNFTKTIRFKLLMILSIFALIYFVTFSFIFAHTISNMKEKILTSYDNLLNVFVNQLKTQISDTDSYLYNLTSSNFDLNMMAIQEPGTDSYSLTKFRIYNNIRLNYSSFSVLDAVYVYDIRSENYLMIPDDSRRYEWIVDRYEDGDVADADRWEVFEQSGSLVLARRRVVSDSLSIVAFIQMEKFVQGLKEISEDNDLKWEVIAEEGRVLYGNYSEDEERIFSGYTCIENEIENIGLTFRLMIRNNSVWLQNLWFALYFGISICIFLAVFGIVFWGSRKRFLAPLEKLIKGMQEFAAGDEDVRVTISGSTEYELRLTIDIFNDMVLQIKKNKFLIYEEKLEKQKLLIQNLQAQIDPHFFSNTLNLIYNLIATKRNQIAQKCILLLSSYYRYMTGISQKQISLEKEYEFVNNYLEIIKLRYPNKLLVSVCIADELKGMQIPPILIQPLVENCIKHGFSDRSQMFLIKISAFIKADEAIISVEDSGAGFPEEYRDTFDLNRPIPARSDDEDYNHIGMMNVYQRLMIFYGEDARMSIDRNENLARVRIVIRFWGKYLNTR